MKSPGRGLVVVGGALIVVIALIEIAGLVTSEEIHDPEPTGTFVPETEAVIEPDCWYVANADTLVVYDQLPDNLASGDERIVPGHARYPVRGRSADFLLITLADSEEVWVRAIPENIEGNCDALPFDPEPDQTNANGIGP
jgi:hypothetical protein